MMRMTGSSKYNAEMSVINPNREKRKKLGFGTVISISEASNICRSTGEAERGWRRICRCRAGGRSLISSGKGLLSGKLIGQSFLGVHCLRHRIWFHYNTRMFHLVKNLINE